MADCGLIQGSGLTNGRFCNLYWPLRMMAGVTSSDIPEVQRSICRQKREFAIALVSKVEDAAEYNDFRRIYLTTKEIVCGPVKNVNGLLLIRSNE